MFGKKKVDPQQAADAFIAHTFGAANETFDDWIQALSVTTGKACDVDGPWLGTYMERQHQKRPLNYLWAAALIAQEAMAIRVCLEPRAANAVLGALHRGLSTGSEAHWFPETVFRYIDAESKRQGMYDQPLLTAFLTDMGYRDEPRLVSLIGHPIWSLPLVEALLTATPAYWKRFAEKSQIRV